MSTEIVGVVITNPVQPIKAVLTPATGEIVGTIIAKIGPDGLSGYSGYSGSGYSGFSGTGSSGFSGFSGYSGYCGLSGYSGFCGLSGYSGYSGSGVSGYSGYSGSGVSGYSGFCGATGSTGTSGFSGYSGFCGLSGYSGFCGASGLSGYSGYSGSGISGYSGYSGSGLSGYSGYSGTAGAATASGFSGYSGFSGANPGASGYSGFCGLSGYSGFCGLSGYSGFCGLSGYSGFSAASPGVSGFSGYSGFCGLSGYSGFCGLSGYSGFCGLSGYSGFSAASPGASGYSGFCGLSGYSGFCGLSGYSGFCGLSGYSGFCGLSGYSGFCGLSGYSGFSAASPGASGFSGYSGFCGLSGYSGFCGLSGYSGFCGLSGYSGYSGSGLSGYSGFSAASPGASGFSGYSGFCGLSGYSGFCGLSGYSGFCGLSGYSGFCGLSGYSGFCGLSGYSGFCGLSGYSGYCGLSGYSGFSSISGYSGFCGLSGYSGFSGGGGASSITKGNSIYVDAIYGNDGTGLTERFDKPFLTVSAAIAIATSGDTIYISPGTFSETTQMIIPSGVSMVGSGIDITTINSSYANADHTTFLPGDNSVISDITFNGTLAAPNFQFLFGSHDLDVTFSGVELYRCKLSAASDNIYLNNATCSLTCYDVICISQFDCVTLVSTGGGSHVVGLYNCQLISTGGFGGSSFARGISCGTGTCRMYGGKIEVNSGTLGNVAITASSSGTVEAYNIVVQRGTGGTSSDLLQSTTGVLKIDNIVRDDGAQLINSGSITYLYPKTQLVQNTPLSLVAGTIVSKAGTVTGTAGVGSSLFLHRVSLPMAVHLTEIDIALSIGFPVTSQGAGTMSRSMVLYSFGNSTSLASVLSKSGSSVWSTGTSTTAGATSLTQFQGGWSSPFIQPMTFASTGIGAGEYVIGQIFNFAQASSTWTLNFYGVQAASSFLASAATNLTSATLGAVSIATAAGSGINGISSYGSAFLALSTSGSMTAFTISATGSTATVSMSSTAHNFSASNTTKTCNFALVGLSGNSNMISSIGTVAGSVVNGLTTLGAVTNVALGALNSSTLAQLTLPNFGFIGTGSTTSGFPTVFMCGIMSTGAVPTAITLTSAAVTYSGSVAFQQPWFALVGA